MGGAHEGQGGGEDLPQGLAELYEERLRAKELTVLEATGQYPTYSL